MAARGSKRVVYAALIGNGLIAVLKFAAAAFTGSSAMLSEGVHSVVDCGNQGLILFGMHRAKRPADAMHPFGYGMELYFWTFVVAILIFAVGAGISMYEGIERIRHPHAIESPWVNYVVLILAMVFEGYAWSVAYKEFNRTRGRRGWIDAVRHSKDPTVFTVLFEDTAAMLGLMIAFVGVMAAHAFGSIYADGIASVAIGAVLALTAVLLSIESKALLIGESADIAVINAVRAIFASDRRVTRVNEVLTMHLGPEDILLVASLDFEDAIRAGALDGAGGAALRGWAEVEAWTETAGQLWLHIDRASPRVQHWLRAKSGLTPVTVEALLAEETRPRSFRGKRGTIAILRGVNPKPGAEPDEMVAIRLWCDGKRLITIRHRQVSTPRDLLVELIAEGTGPATVAELFERLIGRLTDRMAGVIDGFEERLDQLEAAMDETDPVAARGQLGRLRQQAVVVRRYMAPQREAVGAIYLEPPDWLDETSRLRLRETSNRLTQFIESIDEARERAIVLDDGIANRMAETMNRNMYILSIVAAIFLPLGFITGLLGINVGGMPGVDNDLAFWITVVGIVVMLVVELFIFRLLRWI